MLVNWRPARFSFSLLKGHHQKRSIKPYSVAEANQFTLSGQSDATALPSTFRYTLCDTYITFRSLSILESQFSQTWHEAILWRKGFSGMLYSGIDEILVSHPPDMQKCQIVNWITQSQSINL
jgi:hypothetical protein